MKGQKLEKKKQAQAEALLARKELKRRRIMTLFILSTEQLLRTEGIQNLTIRKLADVTGYSSATLYSYFEDLDELILYASFKYRKEYLKQVATEISSEMTSLEQYRKIYEIFNSYSFRDPEIYMNIYFGRHSEKIKEVMDEYYSLFPEEFVAPTEIIRPENADVVAELMVRTQETFLYDLVVNPQKNIQEENAAFMKLFDHIIAVN